MFLFWLSVSIICNIHSVLSQTTSSPNTDETGDGDESDTETMIVIGVISGVIILLCIIIGCMIYKKKRRKSKKDISNLDILDIEEVAPSELPDTNKNGKKNKNKQRAPPPKPNKITKFKTKMSGNKHSNDVLDIEEEDEHNTTQQKKNKIIIITNDDGKVINNDKNNNNKNNIISTDSDDDDLSFHYTDNDGMNTPNDTIKRNVPNLDIENRGINKISHNHQQQDSNYSDNDNNNNNNINNRNIMNTPTGDLDIDLDDDGSD